MLCGAMRSPTPEVTSAGVAPPEGGIEDGNRWVRPEQFPSTDLRKWASGRQESTGAANRPTEPRSGGQVDPLGAAKRPPKVSLDLRPSQIRNFLSVHQVVETRDLISSPRSGAVWFKVAPGEPTTSTIFARQRSGVSRGFMVRLVSPEKAASTSEDRGFRGISLESHPLLTVW